MRHNRITDLWRRTRWLKRCNAEWPTLYVVCDKCGGDWYHRIGPCPHCDHGYVEVTS